MFVFVFASLVFGAVGAPQLLLEHRQQTAPCVSFSVSTSSSWSGGFVLNVRPRNPSLVASLCNWRLQIARPSTLTVSSLWNGQVRNALSANPILIGPPDWSQCISANSDSANAIGIQFEGLGTPSEIAVTAVCDGAPVTTTTASTKATTTTTTTKATTTTTPKATTTTTTPKATTTTTTATTSTKTTTIATAAPTTSGASCLSGSVLVASSWQGGATLSIVVTNAAATPKCDWAISVISAPGVAISSFWNAVQLPNAPAGQLWLGPPSWSNCIAAGATFSIGASVSGASITTSSLQISDKLCGISTSSPASSTSSSTSSSSSSASTSSASTSSSSTSSSTSSPSSSSPWMLGAYYQMYRQSWTLDASAITSLLPNRPMHLVLVFQCAGPDGTLVADGAAGSFAAFKQNPSAAVSFVAGLKGSGRKVLLGIGGAKGYSTGWNYLTSASATTWNNFAQSVKQWVSQFGFDGVVIDYEELQDISVTDPTRAALLETQANAVRYVREALPRPLVVGFAGWSIGGCSGGSECPIFATNANLGMHVPMMLQQYNGTAMENFVDFWHIMTYYTGLEHGAPSAMLSTTVVPYYNRGVPNNNLLCGVLNDSSQYTVQSATTLATACKAAGYGMFLWDLQSQSAPMLNAVA